jgi:tetratricopeptide (TPR) repeat protein
VGQRLYSLGRKDEALDYYDKAINLGVFDIYCAAAQLNVHLIKMKKYDDSIELLSWLTSIIKGMIKVNSVCYLHRILAMTHLQIAVDYCLLKDKKKMISFLEQAKQYAMIFDSNPVFEIYAGAKFVYGPMIDKPIAYDDIGGISIMSGLQTIVREYVHSDEMNFTKAEKEAIDKIMEYMS